MAVYSIDGMVPVVHPSAFVHPDATLIGDVIIGPDCYVAPHASLRGDFGRLVLEQGVNVQDTCVMHGFPNGVTRIEQNGHIGHGAVIHGATIGTNVLVGMNAVVMDDAFIDEGSIVGACAFVKAGFRCPPRSMLLGAPAKIVREVTDEELAWKERGTAEYHELTKRSFATLRECEPLTQIEHDRPRFTGSNEPLHKLK